MLPIQKYKAASHILRTGSYINNYLLGNVNFALSKAITIPASIKYFKIYRYDPSVVGSKPTLQTYPVNIKE